MYPAHTERRVEELTWPNIEESVFIMRHEERVIFRTILPKSQPFVAQAPARFARTVSSFPQQWKRHSSLRNILSLEKSKMRSHSSFLFVETSTSKILYADTSMGSTTLGLADTSSAEAQAIVKKELSLSRKRVQTKKCEGFENTER